MRTLTRLFAVGLLFMLGVQAHAQFTGSADAFATIIAPISITWESDLNFGDLAVNNTLGTATVAPELAATRSRTGGVTFPASTNAPTAAEFTIEGVPGATYSITLPDNVTITNTSSGNLETMVVDNFTSDPTPTGQLSGAGSQTLYVGATVNAAASQAAGFYESLVAFDVTVNYN